MKIQVWQYICRHIETYFNYPKRYYLKYLFIFEFVLPDPCTALRKCMLTSMIRQMLDPSGWQSRWLHMPCRARRHAWSVPPPTGLWAPTHLSGLPTRPTRPQLSSVVFLRDWRGGTGRCSSSHVMDDIRRIGLTFPKSWRAITAHTSTFAIRYVAAPLILQVVAQSDPAPLIGHI